MTLYFCICISLSLPQSLRLPLSVRCPFPALIPLSLCASLHSLSVPFCAPSCVPISPPTRITPSLLDPSVSSSLRPLPVPLSSPHLSSRVALRPFLYPSFCPLPAPSIASPLPLVSVSFPPQFLYFLRASVSPSAPPFVPLFVLPVWSGSGPPPPQPSPAANEQRSL